jgi:hypothetical protein
MAPLAVIDGFVSSLINCPDPDFKVLLFVVIVVDSCEADNKMAAMRPLQLTNA